MNCVPRGEGWALHCAPSNPGHYAVVKKNKVDENELREALQSKSLWGKSGDQRAHGPVAGHAV